MTTPIDLTTLTRSKLSDAAIAKMIFDQFIAAVPNELFPARTARTESLTSAIDRLFPELITWTTSARAAFSSDAPVAAVAAQFEAFPPIVRLVAWSRLMAGASPDVARRAHTAMIDSVMTAMGTFAPIPPRG